MSIRLGVKLGLWDHACVFFQTIYFMIKYGRNEAERRAIKELVIVRREIMRVVKNKKSGGGYYG